MKRNLYAALAGATFGLGLLLSGMTDTLKVQGWLDLFGAWDPTLAFVMAGAILPMALAWRVTRLRGGSVLGTAFPTKPDVRLDPNLIVGSIFFGAGWALAGLCPGPAMATATFSGAGGLLFLLAMVAGMVAAPALKTRIARLGAAA
ncbi:DUF6691 family protein [Frigidibacter sp. SD6-1]|uniref:DUF6691 family protein n=1 Tax=Frigidibacter sp. SD6-1 TaxID=3032581 RepID=UPI0024E0028D|nr:DUF6691 family protein [Frigidibacter sp. SD6-1]